IFFRSFFCQGFSSFSLLGPLRRSLGIQRRLLLRPSHADGYASGVVSGTGATSLLLDLGGGPLEAGADLLGLYFHLGPPLSLGRLPRIGAKAPHDHDTAPLGQRLRHVLGERTPRRHVEE